MSRIVFGRTFLPEKTSDQFLEVNFNYDGYEWNGALPIVVRSQGLSLTEVEVKSQVEIFYESLRRENRKQWIESALEKWSNQKSQTFKVFNALLSGEWECRVCGPVPKVNPQPAARIRDIKGYGFFVASKRKQCKQCQKVCMHDILVMIISLKEVIKVKFRKPISKQLNQNILKVLKSTESVFEQVRTSKELVIDHKFPSQRWLKPETDNNTDMPDEDIKKKFQLLNNQTNLLKSRECDRCVSQNIRGQFMGIRWYYSGNEKWEKEIDDETGCVGCPWYDVAEWKEQLRRAVKTSKMGHLDEKT